jgi:hypothetical protein
VNPTCTVAKSTAVNTGSYTITEPTVPTGWNPLGTLPTGWSAPGTIICDGQATNNLSIASGETKTCYILNVNQACTPAFPGVGPSNIQTSRSTPALLPASRQAPRNRK